MKKLLLIIALAATTLAKAQTQENGIVPPKGGQAESFTDWKKVPLVFDDGYKAEYEYRIAFIKRKSLACTYELQVKNNADKKLKFKVKTHYYDRFVKGRFGDKFEEKIKTGETVSFLIITQGNKANKEIKDESDYDRCMGCDLSYEIEVIKD